LVACYIPISFKEFKHWVGGIGYQLGSKEKNFVHYRIPFFQRILNCGYNRTPGYHENCLSQISPFYIPDFRELVSQTLKAGPYITTDLFFKILCGITFTASSAFTGFFLDGRFKHTDKGDKL
jgi:hypothetical protein